jgi:Nucleoside 2-deoxyribosyltransferase
MKVYLAHPISTRGEFEDSKRVANRIRALGYEVYAAAENASINDKSNDPTPADIYDADVIELLSSDIVVVNLTGGLADGTITEVGVVAGANEKAGSFYAGLPSVNKGLIPIIAYTSNARLLQPQFHKGIPSASANHLTLGAVERWGEFVGGEDDMIAKLKSLAGDGASIS